MKKTSADIQSLDAFLRANPRIVVLCGAGISLASGIPTYRDREGVWRHGEPIKHQEFMDSPDKRRRYWARSVRGWPSISAAQPSPAHRALSELERAGRIDTIISQNVDRLQQRAGGTRVIDLHGRLDRVFCLDCGACYDRDAVQQQLLQSNPGIGTAGALRPDGDADIATAAEQRFSVPDCLKCRGVLMPDVVFFGGTVPRERVRLCMDALERADGLLAVGSSLQVFSGFRFCRRAAELGKPLALLNPGRTRADELAQLKVAGDCQQLLPALAAKWSSNDR